MANAFLTTQKIADRALTEFKNQLVMARMVYRGYESEWSGSSFAVGETVTVRRPQNFEIRSGRVANVQDVTDATFALTVDQQKGVDMEVASKDMTLSIDNFAKRYLRPATTRIANEVDSNLLSLYSEVSNWVGTPGNVIDSYSDWSYAAQRLDELGVPTDMRSGVLSPADYHGLGRGQVTLNSSDDLVEEAYQRSRLGMIAGIDTYMSQNVQNHTVGAHGGTPKIRGAANSTTYAASKQNPDGQMVLSTDGWSTAVVLKAGDVFTIDDVYAVNRITGAQLDYLQEFRVVSDVTTNANAANETQITIAPAIITSGPYKTVDSVPANDADINYKGTASTAYRQNLAFHRDAFALVMVPMERHLPGTDVSIATDDQTGLSIRYGRQYDIINDVTAHRLDVLYGLKAINPQFATRVSGRS